MAEDEVQSPEWWLKRLHLRLHNRKPAFEVLDNYYMGENLPMKYATERFREHFRRIVGDLNDNWCQVVIDAVEERLNIQGFRVPVEGENQSEEPDPSQADTDAWTIWQRNNLDAGAQMAHTESLVTGVSNVIIWADQDGKALITPERSDETVVEYVPGSHRQRAAALKEWRDDWTGRAMATLYLPNAVYKFISVNEIRGEVPQRVQWEPRDVDGESWPIENRLGLVPMVPLSNKTRLRHQSDSEIRTVIPIQDAVNKLIADMMVASEFQSFRQRWATGIEIPVDPESGKVVEPFTAAVDRLWATESEGAKFGEFSQADLRIFVAAIEMFVQHMATQSRTPPHYFYLRGEFPSGESIKSAETGLVAKTKRKMTHFGDQWEEIMRIGFLIEGDRRRGSSFKMETIWTDPESRTEGEHTDAMIKLKNLNVPDEALWERWGFSPQEIERFKQMRENEPEPEPVEEEADAGQ